MAGIYIHIPFCKQACIYCDFHFSTSLKNREGLVSAIVQELYLRKEELTEPIETIYFGGGTPSILVTEEIERIIDQINSLFDVNAQAEITLEGNPDDLHYDKLIELKNIGINRLSVGIQSFLENDLRLLNRAHNSKESYAVIENIQRAGYNNYTIDLIYGLPNQTDQQWLDNLNKIKEFNVPHFSAYSLTVEPKTVLAHRIKKGDLKDIDDERTSYHFKMLMEFANENGYCHYEISNLAKKGFEAKHNKAYWQGKPYLGVGPSAHSFNGTVRSWNVSNNHIYIKEILSGKLPSTKEELSEQDSYNEKVMTGLRLLAGLSINQINNKFHDHFVQLVQKWIARGYVIEDPKGNYRLSTEGKFFADQIASDLFYVD